MRRGHTQWPEKLNVWVGIVGDQVIGPVFFNTSIRERFLEFLENELVSNLAVLNNYPVEADVPNQNIWFQEDGTPPLYARPVREYLDQVFPGKCIGRRGPLEWP